MQPVEVEGEAKSSGGLALDSEQVVDPQTAKFVADRSLLGTFVLSLGVGAPVGEMAMLTMNVRRAAYVLANEDHTYLIRIDRELFNITMKRMIEEDYRCVCQCSMNYNLKFNLILAHL